MPYLRLLNFPIISTALYCCTGENGGWAARRPGQAPVFVYKLFISNGNLTKEIPFEMANIISPVTDSTVLKLGR